MKSKEEKVLDFLEKTEDLDKETVLAIWLGLTSNIAIVYPNELFHLMRNMILNPFKSNLASIGFDDVAGAVFYSISHVILNNSKYKNYYESIPKGQAN